MSCTCVAVVFAVMGRKVQQFGLLLWKNYLLQRRKVLVTCLEIGLPTVLALILIFVRQSVPCNRVVNPMLWNEFAVNDTLGRCQLTQGPWQIYFAPNSTTTVHILELAMTHLRRLHCADSCIKGQLQTSVSCL